MVPKRRPPRPHSCSWSRSPLRQWAAAKPSHVMKPNSAMKMIRAVQFTSCTACLPIFTFLFLLPCIPATWRDNVTRRRPLRSQLILLCREIDDRGQHRRDDHPEHLIPVEERDARPSRLDRVVERRPKHGSELNDQEQVPPAPAGALVSFLIHCVSTLRLAFREPFEALARQNSADTGTPPRLS